MKRRQSDPKVIYRVRGWNGDEIRHSRVYQRRADAIANYLACHRYYERVTIDTAGVTPFQRLDIKPWWLP